MKGEKDKYFGLSGEKLVQIVAGLLTVGLLLSIHLVDPHFYGKMWSLATTGNMHEIVHVLRSYGPWAMLVSLLLEIFVNAVGFLPSIFISTANGLVFGIFWGTVISWIAETIGVVISFYIMRYLFRDSADVLIRKSPTLMKVDDFSGKNGFIVMLFARSIPYFPSGVITALGAISKITPRDYILANLVGKFPSTALEVAVGYDIVNFEAHMMRLVVVVIGAAGAYFVLWQVYKKYMAKKHATEEKVEH